MKTNSKNRFIAMLLIGALAVMAPQWVMALTPACTAINNTATISYKVGTVDQAPVSGAAPEFKVGNKINLTVVTTDGSAVTVNQGNTNKVLGFTVTNTGNYTQDYSLTAVDKGSSTYTIWVANDTVDNFSAGAAIVRVESGANGGYQSGEDTATSIDNLAPGDPAKTVYIIAPEIPLQSNGDKSAYSLQATALQADGTAIPAHNGNGAVKTTAGATACTTDFVYGDDYPTDNSPEDGSSDGQSSAMSAFVVSAIVATLEVTKTSAVYSDPINGTSSPKAIPGAVVTYTVTITNPAGSSATASSVSISDDLSGPIGGGSLAFGNTPIGWFKDATTTCSATNDIVVDNVCYSNDDDGGTPAAKFASNILTVSGISLVPGATSVIRFQVTIQ